MKNANKAIGEIFSFSFISDAGWSSHFLNSYPSILELEHETQIRKF